MGGHSAVRKEAVELGLRHPLKGMARLKLGVTQDRVQTRAVPLTCCGSLGWLFTLCEPSLAHL